MTIPLRSQIGKNIKKFRIKAGFTQEQLAEVAGIDYKYLQRLEGKVPPNIKADTIAKLAKALKINGSKLLDS